MTEEQLKEAGLDWEITVERFCGNKNLYVKFLKKFTEDQNFSLLQEAWKEKDAEKTERIAHTLKGTCANLGMPLLAEKFDKIVQAMRKRNEKTGFAQEELLHECEREYQKIWMLLKELN